VTRRRTLAGMRSLALAASAALALIAAGCGAEQPGEPAVEGTTPAPTSTVPETAPVVVALYFLRDGEVGLARRAVVPDEAGDHYTAVGALLDGPAGADRKAGLSTAIPPNTTLDYLGVEQGTAAVGPLCDLSSKAQAQIVFTLTQFMGIERVSFCGRPAKGRADFEEQTPAILVESPAPWEQASSPLRISGTANTFEATFNVEIVNVGGRVLGKRFVTATSGSGERGTFEASVPFRLEGAGPYRLVVYELSAEDGSRMNEVQIPLDLLPD
jgi:germination protein M